ncbi:Head-to-tail connector protein, podovirus-type [uncultured Caudovirales phage]|uniref:Head-to-tail connector protein, podovirus-type n=1 Tax=uncultured Caudovirales phage TaxID=2100421 RepID=A0A6J5L0C9_9CAUD|nr:Head-to-tail connector protein, podovirus-type [uncultured Caudovirales phage]
MNPRDILARADRLKSARAVFSMHWQEVSDYILPSREFTRITAPGSKRITRIFHTGPVTAADQLAAGLHGMLTSPALRWFKLRKDRAGSDAPPAQEGDDAAAWLDMATETLYATFNSPRACFTTAAHELYQDIVAFGNGPMFMDDGGIEGVRFHTLPLAECFVALDAYGRVDTLYRMYQMTAHQIADKWPNDMPEAVSKHLEKEPDRKFDLVHAVFPKPEGAKGLRWLSYYLLKDHPDQPIEKGGYDRFPYIFARWKRRSGEDYGAGPGMDLLPDIRLLNKLEEINLRGVAKVVDPSVFVPDDGFLGPLTTAPNTINYFRAGQLQEGDRPFTLPNAARPDIGAEKTAEVMGRIEQGFYVTWMNLPTRPNMTATEVLQRRDEQLRLLGPMVSRLQEEFLGPLIGWTLDTLIRNGAIPPAPQGLLAYEIEYQSPLALSQKTSDADGVIRWVQGVAEVAQMDPAALDVVDAGEVVRFLGSRFGVPPKVVRSMEAAQAMADQRQQQQAQMAQISGAQGIARAAKDGAGAMQALGAMAQGAA